MNPVESREERALRSGFAVPAPVAPEPSRISPLHGGIFLALLALVFGRDIYSLVQHALGHELHSHLILIPFISAYLIYINRDLARVPRKTSIIPAIAAGLLGIAALVSARYLAAAAAISHNDYLGLAVAALILILVAGGYFFLGTTWMRAAMFPVGFLFFTVPLPDHLAETLETLSKLGSAETTAMFFSLSGTPYYREGLFFQLPNIALEVAQECSGIRSSYVLLITSVLASYLFLSQPWRRLTLVACVIPLGLLRNGFRILVIGLLCVYIDPEMIHSVIHRRGGPIFFVLSLIPLFALLWALRRGDPSRRARLD